MATGAAAAAWDRANTVRVHLKLNKHTDAEIIEKLSKVDSKQGYIKQLIREDLEREGNKMDNKTWYAVLRDSEDNDWGTGTHSLTEAMQMARKMRAEGDQDAYIAVIDDGIDPVCVDTIRDLDA